MKILVVTPLFPSKPDDHIGGFIVDSICALKKEGCDISLLVMRPWVPWILEKLKPGLKKGVDTSRIPAEIDVTVCYYFSIPRNYLRWLSNKISIKQIAAKIANLACFSKFNLIHVHNELSVPAVITAGNNLSIPVVATVHGAETNRRYWRASGKLISQALGKLNKLVLVGEPLVPFFRKRASKNNHFTVVPNGFEFSPEMLDVKKSEWVDELRFVSVSNLSDEGKCIDITLRAFAELEIHQKYNWIYTIVGDGCKRNEYQDLVISLGLKDKVRFVGACSHKEVYQHLQQSNIFCLPSCREAFGVAHLESMAFGLLSIGVRGQGPEMFIQHEKTGILVEPESVSSLVKALKSIFERPNDMQKIALQGKTQVHTHFTWKQHAEKLMSVYKEVSL